MYGPQSLFTLWSFTDKVYSEIKQPYKLLSLGVRKEMQQTLPGLLVPFSYISMGNCGSGECTHFLY